MMPLNRCLEIRRPSGSAGVYANSVGLIDAQEVAEYERSSTAFRWVTLPAPWRKRLIARVAYCVSLVNRGEIVSPVDTVFESARWSGRSLVLMARYVPGIAALMFPGIVTVTGSGGRSDPGQR